MYARANSFLPCSTCSTTRRHFLAANPPMDTWSSVPALVVKESMEAGWHRTLFSDTTDWKHNTFRVSIYLNQKRMYPDNCYLLLNCFTQRCRCAVGYHESRIQSPVRR